MSAFENHDLGDEDRSVDLYCCNCGDPFDEAAERAALRLPSAWRPCPNPSPGRAFVDCGVGRHMYTASKPKAS